MQLTFDDNAGNTDTILKKVYLPKAISDNTYDGSNELEINGKFATTGTTVTINWLVISLLLGYDIFIYKFIIQLRTPSGSIVSIPINYGKWSTNMLDYPISFAMNQSQIGGNISILINATSIKEL